MYLLQTGKLRLRGQNWLSQNHTVEELQSSAWPVLCSFQKREVHSRGGGGSGPRPPPSHPTRNPLSCPEVLDADKSSSGRPAELGRAAPKQLTSPRPLPSPQLFLPLLCWVIYWKHLFGDARLALESRGSAQQPLELLLPPPEPSLLFSRCGALRSGRGGSDGKRGAGGETLGGQEPPWPELQLEHQGARRLTLESPPRAQCFLHLGWVPRDSAGVWEAAGGESATELFLAPLYR